MGKKKKKKSEEDGSLGQESCLNKTVACDSVESREDVAGFLRGGSQGLDSTLKIPPP